MLTEADIREALRACYDIHNPFGQPVNIVDLGLVEAIELALDPDAPGAGIPGVPSRQRLSLTLVPTTQDEDARAQLSAQIANRLAGLPELWRTSIRFATEPAWTPARISPQGRALLKLDAAHFPILNNR
jgi:metal-sulfur cluster biosynthetic enzyme